MGFWNSYPFTDYYRAQLDWIIARMKEIAPTVARLQEIETNVNAALARCEQIATDVDLAEQNCIRIEQICNNMLSDIEAAKDSAIEDIETATNTAIDRALAEINAALATIDEHVQDARTWSDIARQKADSATRSAEICYGYTASCLDDANRAENAATSAETAAGLYTSTAEKWIKTHQNNIVAVNNIAWGGAIARAPLYTIQRCNNSAPDSVQRFSFPFYTISANTLFNTIYIELDTDNSMEIDLVQETTTVAAIRVNNPYECVNITWANNQYVISDSAGTIYATISSSSLYIPLNFQDDTANNKIFSDYLMVRFSTGGKPLAYSTTSTAFISIVSQSYSYKILTDYNLLVVYAINASTAESAVNSIVSNGGVICLSAYNQYMPQNYKYAFKSTLTDFANNYW